MMSNASDDPSSSRRPYRSERRGEQARRTRATILETAKHLFLTRGYAAVTLKQIAEGAGVAMPTVTAIFGAKPNLLRALIQQEVRGEDPATPLSAGALWQDMLQEPDAVKQIGRFAHLSRLIHARTTDLFEVVRGAATASSEMATFRADLNRRRLKDVESLAASLAAKQAFRSGVSDRQALDLLWTLGSAELFRMLVVERQWTPDAYEEWLNASLRHNLIGS